MKIRIITRSWIVCYLDILACITHYLLTLCLPIGRKNGTEALLLGRSLLNFPNFERVLKIYMRKVIMDNVDTGY